MAEYLLRFLAGGVAVAAFAALGDMLRPKSFAGIFAAAPSIALATLVITLSRTGASFAATEAQSMMAGAIALAAYSWTVCLLLKRFMVSPLTATLGALAVWFAVAFGILFLFDAL
jgi:uncharacterized membrane protein (GlpM family)